MNYGGAVPDPALPQPSISNISFVNVTAAATRVAGQLAGFNISPVRGLHFEDCDFRATADAPWALTDVDVASCSSVATQPPFPTV